MPDRSLDRLVVGGGIVGLAVARELLHRSPGLRLALLDKEPELASHQSGHNSGVVHSGVYYRPGSLKARLCLEGRRLLLRFCDEKAIPYRIGGKLIVAVAESDLAPLAEILARGESNGVEGIRRIGPEEIREREPHATGLAAIWVPPAGVVDYKAVASALAADVRERGGEVLLSRKVVAIEARPEGPVVLTENGAWGASRAIVCAGLQSDRLARVRGDRRRYGLCPSGATISCCAPRSATSFAR